MSDLLNKSKPKVSADPFIGTSQTEFRSPYKNGVKAQFTKTEDTFKVDVEVDKGSMIVGGGVTTYNSEDGYGFGGHFYGVDRLGFHPNATYR
ncbi:MAG: hypothetical protein ABJQ70_14240 [Roseobacter sp.]